MKKIMLLTALMLAGVCTSEAQQITSYLEILNPADGSRQVVKSFPALIEAPNWTSDNQLIFNSNGLLYSMPADGSAEPVLIPTGFADRCNNDHVLSADGSRLAISHATKEDHKSRIYTLPVTGGTPQLITPLGPSYLHGWSPDGKELAYCAERGGQYDVYVIPATGGNEIRLTETTGLDDGPEYSSCGKYIWFNSTRSGLMQIWRMNRDGSTPVQMANELHLKCWFPPILPDGKSVVYLAYQKEDVAPGSHPANKNVSLWIMPAEGGTPHKLIDLFGGQGTINVNSWNPESNRFAFVSYQLTDEAE